MAKIIVAAGPIILTDVRGLFLPPASLRRA
jgi:hypothetical protein